MRLWPILGARRHGSLDFRQALTKSARKIERDQAFVRLFPWANETEGGAMPSSLTEAEIGILRDSPLFSDVPPDLLKDLLMHGSRRELKRGENLFVQGDPATSLFMVLDGLVKLSRLSAAGEEIVVAVYGRGESFGEAAAMRGGTYPVTVDAVVESCLFQITARTIAARIRDHPELAMAMLASTYRHLHELVHDIEDMKGHTGAQRLAAFLVALSPSAEGPSRFVLPYDKNLIAARLGMKPESLSRSIASLRGQGVRVQGGKVEVEDMGRLKAVVLAEKPGRLIRMQHC